MAYSEVLDQIEKEKNPTGNKVFADYRQVDLSDIMSLFDEYKTLERSIKNRL